MSDSKDVILDLLWPRQNGFILRDSQVDNYSLLFNFIRLYYQSFFRAVFRTTNDSVHELVGIITDFSCTNKICILQLLTSNVLGEGLDNRQLKSFID